VQEAFILSVAEDFSHPRKSGVGKYLKIPGLRFSHHKTPADLCRASNDGCSLLEMITTTWQRKKSQLQYDEEGSEIRPLVFKLSLDGGCCWGFCCSGGGWNLRTQFELYEFGDPDPPEAFDAERAITGIWISRQHLGDHTLSESTGKIMDRWVQECLDSHEECRHILMGGYSPTRLIDVGPKGGLKEPSLVDVGE